MASPSLAARAAILGMPYDPNKKPDRLATVKAFELMDAKAMATSAGAIVRDTLADLGSVTNPPAHQMGWVTGDATAANNGIYENAGSPSAPNWLRRADLPYGLIHMINAGAGTADAIVATSALPLPVAPGAALLTVNIVADNTGSVTLNGKPLRTNSGNEISAGGLTAGSIHAFLDLGDHFRLLSDQASAAIVAQAEAEADRAEAARDSALGAVPNVFTATRAALAALDTTTVTAAYLTEPRREGQFLWTEGDFSAEVVKDEWGALFIASDDVSPEVGAWVRAGNWRQTGVPMAWFGFTSDVVLQGARAVGSPGNWTCEWGDFQDATDWLTAAGFPILIDDLYRFDGCWMVKSHARIIFAPGKGCMKCEVSDPVIGAFFTGDFSGGITAAAPVTDIKVWGLNIDCGYQQAMNGLGIPNFTRGRFHGITHIRNSRHSVLLLGGRAVQFEGDACEDIHISELDLLDCSIGINSQAMPEPSTYTAKHISYGKVTMRDVGMPFNIDCTTSGSETLDMRRMSTTIGEAVLYNCGRPQWLDSIDRMKGGIITGDRGSGLSIDWLRIVNDASYGLVGGLFKGTMYNVVVGQAEMIGQFYRIADFNYLDFITSASSASHPSSVEAHVICRGTVERILDTKTGGGTIGYCNLTVEIDPANISSGLVTADAGDYDSALLTLVDLSTGVRSPTRTARQIYGWGNSFDSLRGSITAKRFRRDMTDAEPRIFFTFPVPPNGRAAAVVNAACFGVASGSSAATVQTTARIAIARDGGGALTYAVATDDPAEALDGYASLALGFSVVEMDAGTAAIAISQSNSFGAELTVSASAEITLATAGGVVQITEAGIR